MTAYVLLAHLTQPQVSSADLSRASQIVRWLSRQQNPYGGFASTQVRALGSQQGAGAAAGTNGVTMAGCFSPRTPWWPCKLWPSTPL